MTTDNTADTELEKVRRILLGPVDQNNEARDKRIMDFIRDETTANAAQLDRMEIRLREITAMVNKTRRDTLNELSKAISDLAEHPLKKVQDANGAEVQGNVQALTATRKTS